MNFSSSTNFLEVAAGRTEGAVTSEVVVPLPGARTEPVPNPRCPGARPKKIVNIRRGVGMKSRRLEQQAREKAAADVARLRQAYEYHLQRSQEVTREAIYKLQEVGFDYSKAAVQFLVKGGL